MGTQTYARRTTAYGALLGFLHMPCHLRTTLLVALLLSWTLSCSEPSVGSPFISEASYRLAGSFENPEEALAELAVRARTAAVRLHTDARVEELEPFAEELQLTVRAIAALEGAADFPWRDWCLEHWKTLPLLTEQYLLCSAEVQPLEEAVRAARLLDLREMDRRVRVQAHRLFWRHDPAEALVRGRKLLFRERPRASDSMRPAYVEEVLVGNEHADAKELLLQVCAKESMSSLARRLAMRELAKVGSQVDSAVLESVFDTEATDLLVRKEAMLTILELDPPRAITMLEQRMPSRSRDPGLFEFMMDLRKEQGMPTWE